MLHVDNSQVLLEDIKIYAYHGVLPQERVVGAYYIINIGIETDFSQAMDCDDLSGTISYAEVYDIIKAEMEIPSQLVEHVAGRICRAIFDRFPSAKAVHLKILKENPPMGADCRGAGVSLSVKCEA